MILYAIRQKSTNFFLPYRKSSKGFTRDEPQKECMPRLFKSKRAASQALNWWLEGQWGWIPDGDGFNEPLNYVVDAHKLPHRKKEDMEIISMMLTEFNPRGKGKKK